MTNEFFRLIGDDLIECLACNWKCKISKNKVGVCGVRANIDGKLELLVDNKAIGLWPDPVEKKPLFHFLPGSKALSLGTMGCNFGCAFCQNWFQSQAVKGLNRKTGKIRALINKSSSDAKPDQIVKLAKMMGCQSVAYTYNEPAVFVEYALKTMKLAKKAGLKNIWVSNGFESDKTVKEIIAYVDAINIDIKSISDKFYQNICKAKIEPVLKNIKKIFKAGVWLEITSLIIPDENDSQKEMKQIADFITGVDKNIVWHVTAFHPDYKMKNKQATSLEKLKQAWQIGKEAGLNYVYVGNVIDDEHSQTKCPNCNNLVIERNGFGKTRLVGMKAGRCGKCGQKIAGVWS